MLRLLILFAAMSCSAVFAATGEDGQIRIQALWSPGTHEFDVTSRSKVTWRDISQSQEIKAMLLVHVQSLDNGNRRFTTSYRNVTVDEDRTGETYDIPEIWFELDGMNNIIDVGGAAFAGMPEESEQTAMQHMYQQPMGGILELDFYASVAGAPSTIGPNGVVVDLQDFDESKGLAFLGFAHDMTSIEGSPVQLEEDSDGVGELAAAQVAGSLVVDIANKRVVTVRAISRQTVLIRVPAHGMDHVEFENLTEYSRVLH